MKFVVFQYGIGKASNVGSTHCDGFTAIVFGPLRQKRVCFSFTSVSCSLYKISLSIFSSIRLFSLNFSPSVRLSELL